MWPSLKPFIIGTKADPYLKRWFILPRNRWFNIYLHKFCKSDDDRALHDHPWWNVSFLLSGSYVEHSPDGATKRRVGVPVVRRAEASHRVELIDGRHVWTLFVTGPRVREWGFHCPKGWRHWTEFISERDGGNETGKGCGD